MSSDLRRIIRRSGILEATEPAELLRVQKATAALVDPNESLYAKAGDPFRSPQVLHWFSGDPYRMERAAQSGKAVLFCAYAFVPPTTGTCVVSLTMNGGVVGSVSILNGQTIGETSLNLVVPNGSWFGAFLSTPNGASLVSTSLTLNVGSN